MNEFAFVALVHNAALLLALVLVYDLTLSRYPLVGNWRRQVAFGSVLGFMGVVIMLEPFQIAPGVVFDTRSVLLAVSGLFFGGIPTATAMLVTATYRLSQGGLAAWNGVGMIVVSGGLGLLWRQRRHGALADIRGRELYGFGLVVHVVILVLVLTLGWKSGTRALAMIGPPVLIIYPVATVVLGLLLANQLRRSRKENLLHETLSLLRIAGRMARFGGWSLNLAEHRLYWSDETAVIHEMPPGFSPLVSEGISFCAPEWREKIVEAFDACVRDGTPYDEEMEILTASGKRIWVRTSGEPIRDKSGKIASICGAFQDITERKCAEIALARSVDRYEKASRATVSVIWDWDVEAGVLLWSQNLRTVFGYQEGELDPDIESWRQRLHPEDRERVVAGIRAALASGADAWSDRYRFRCQDGHYADVEDRGIIARDADGGAVRMIGALEDITKRTQVEAALRASEQRYRALFENRHTVMLLIDAEGAIVDANPAAADFYGWTRDELRRKFIAEIDALPAGEVQENLQQVLRGERNCFHFSHRLSDGSLRDVEVHSGPVELAGRPLLFSIVHDITERRQAERAAAAAQAETARLLSVAEQSRHALLSVVEDHRATEGALRISEERYREIFQSSPIGIWEEDFSAVKKRFDVLRESGVTDFRQHLDSNPAEVDRLASLVRIVSVNAAARQTLGLERVDNLVLSWFFTAESWLAFKEEMIALAAGSLRFDWESPTLTATGDRRMLALSLAVSRGSEVSLARVMVTTSDITARKRTEAEIVQLNLSLERRVVERTAELEGANKELEAFSYSVSHDLIAPLRAIDGYAQILREDFGAALNAEGRQVLEIVVKETRRMQGLVADLLNLSRFGQIPLDLQPLDMTELARQVGSELLVQAPDRPIDLTVLPLPEAQADANLMRPVLTNLLSNAIKYSSRQARSLITVSGAIDGGEAVYRVTDNGAGFDMRYVDRLFGVFQRLHTDAEFEGTGVGLALVKRIVQRHGGRVWAEGREGEGATFGFTLPLPLVPFSPPGTASSFQLSN